MARMTIKNVTTKKVIITAKDQSVALKFPFTTGFARTVGWFEELPEMTGTWSPDAPHNRVEVRTITFTPTDLTQASRAFSLECHGYMENFTVIRKAAKGKDAKRAQLKKTDVTCTVAFQDENGAGVLTNYMRQIATSSLMVTYDPTPVQEELPGTDTPDDEQQGIFDQPDQNGSGEPQDDAELGETGDDTTEAPADAPEAPVKRGRGRPKGSTNKPKPEAAE